MDVESSATLGTLMLRLAERVGLALYESGERARLPEDADDLGKLMDFVNEGYDRFLRASPKWTFLELPVTLTVDNTGARPESIAADPGRYRLPPYVSSAPKGNWRYADETSPYSEVVCVNAALVLARRQTMPSSGPPRHACHRSIESEDPIDGGRRAMEVVFHPTPDATYVLEATFRVRSHRMVDLAERHVCGADHDAAIAAFAAWAWFEDDAEDPVKAATYKASADERLAESLALDRENRPRTVGPVTDPSTTRRAATRYLPRVATHNGNTIPYD